MKIEPIASVEGLHTHHEFRGWCMSDVLTRVRDVVQEHEAKAEIVTQLLILDDGMPDVHVERRTVR